MLGSADIIAFTSSTDLAGACEFYEVTLGIRLVERSDFACVFDANGTMLRVTKVDEVAQAAYTVLGWQVADITGTVAELAGRGVVFARFGDLPQDDLGVWTAPGGDKVAWFRDPDGNIVSLTEFAAPG